MVHTLLCSTGTVLCSPVPKRYLGPDRERKLPGQLQIQVCLHDLVRLPVSRLGQNSPSPPENSTCEFSGLIAQRIGVILSVSATDLAVAPKAT